MDRADHSTGGPADDLSTTRSLLRRVLIPIAVGLGIVAAAAAVIVWLPLDKGVEADVKETLVGYETAREVAWPAASPITVPLPDAQQATLAAQVERDLDRYAAADALARIDTGRVAAAFAKAVRLDRPWVVTRWDAEVVYFDFVRQSLRGDVIVRAGVRRSHQVGRMNEKKQRIVARRWVTEDGVAIDEYRLRNIDGAWKVVDVDHWGRYGPQGTPVQGGDSL